MADEISTPLQFGNARTVAVKVGRPPTAFYIHRDLLCRESPVFKAALSQSGKQLLDLAEDDAEAFDRISNWMYTGKLRMSNQEGVYYMQYATVYAVAEKYRMVRLKNYVINQLIRKAQQWPFIPPMDVVKYVYSTTPPRCPLRKLLVALLVLTLHNSSVEIILSDALKEVPEFAADLATACCNTFSGDPTQVKFMGLVEDYYEKS